jgi:hypothetical protein
MSKRHGDAAAVFQGCGATFCIFFETFIGSLEHGSIISVAKRMTLSSEIIPSPAMIFSASRVNITTTIERSEQHATYSR